ncbi:DNA-binding protein H-NS [Tistlia consotensis]|uniref:DNA-binding protein H-NS n=1 Tax=Tistlia consotensis USBA 355 TaxID=560819 RepID=A0A1Y6CQZ5_9PROT|nr:H-NS histone family protein [Tistlia consotensis]SMF82117.1 DNA-binding protein H-NS [Tistlia consotensis USBA 355]SNS25524.1 DNA-binding protein H-NS [Tistlia consotensis]
MAAPNLEKMSVTELRDLIARAEGAIAKKAKEERKSALEEARKAAGKHGFTLEELLAEAPKKRGRSGGSRQLKPKFRHPENPETTWSGVGRRPRWIVEAEEAGSLEQLRIPE